MSCAPTGTHFHHWHDVNDPDCIIRCAKRHGIITTYTFSEQEYQSLRARAKRLRLNKNLIDNLDRSFRTAHDICGLKRSGMFVDSYKASMIGDYHQIANQIQKIENQFVN
ncbi:MAG: hypothetical protein FJ356_06580 [Thaumarchaeota archaeon]|nr:hypothetical protein [Nitrososphaerota archaeon]